MYSCALLVIAGGATIVRSASMLWRGYYLSEALKALCFRPPSQGRVSDWHFRFEAVGNNVFLSLRAELHVVVRIGPRSCIFACVQLQSRARNADSKAAIETIPNLENE